MFKFLFLAVILWLGWAIIYENLFLPFLSNEIPITSLSSIKGNNISTITIYDQTDAYITLNMGELDIKKIGPFKMGLSRTYYVRIISVERFYEDLKKYYGVVGDNVDIYYKNFTRLSVMSILLVFIFYNLVNVLFMVVMRKSDNMGGIFGKMVGVDKDFMFVKNERTRLSDVAGSIEIKEEVMELVDIIKRGVEYVKMGARLPKGALFTGPPGTGKTLMARAVAGECGFSFLSVSGSDFNEILVGVGSSRVRNLFEKAKANKPCIIFIDEIDALASKRVEKMQQKDDKDNTLNALLVEMDGFGINDGIVVFGATNRAEVLDPAILRAGRFDRKVHFGLPDKNDRREIFSYYFRKVKWVNNEERDNILEKIVGVSYGLTGADVSNLVNEAVILAVGEKRNGLIGEDIMRSLEYVVCGKEKKNYFMTEREKKVVAYHESGHALMGWILKGCSVPVRVSMIPTGKSALGYTMRENEENKLKTKEEMLAEIGMMLGGRLAEEIFIGEITTGASDDFKKAINQAKSMVIDYNFFMDDYVLNEEGLGDDSKKMIDKVSTKIVRSMYKIGKENMEKYRDILEKMVNRLRNEGKLEGKVIGEIFGEDIRDVVGLNLEKIVIGD